MTPTMTTEVFRGCSRSLPTNSWVISKISARHLASTSFPFCFALLFINSTICTPYYWREYRKIHYTTNRQTNKQTNHDYPSRFPTHNCVHTSQSYTPLPVLGELQKLLVSLCLFPPSCCSFLSFPSKYSPRHLFLTSIFVFLYRRTDLTTTVTHSSWQYTHFLDNLYLSIIFGHLMHDQTIQEPKLM